MTDTEKVSAFVDAKSAETIALSEKIWNFAEPNWRETQSANASADALRAEGFSIETAPCGMKAAFVATYANGGPTIAYLGEYDALSGLSQEAATPHHAPIASQKLGHGCGHNLLGGGSFAAAVALKDYIRETGLSATVQFFGCPAEEDGGGKMFFAREGYFDSVAAVFAWHPGSANYVCGQGCLAVSGVLYKFKGRTAHAACAPFAGRSALDAAELMSVGCNYLREHIIPEARLHYAYRDVGGTAPNVVQENACVHYFIRAPKVAQMLAIKERVADVARGAALMTGTSLTMTDVDGSCDFMPNRVLSELLHDCMQAVGAPQFDADDYALAAEFIRTISENERNDNLVAACRATHLPLAYFKDKVLDTSVPAFVYQPNTAEMGSTDVGDVSYCVPTAQCNYATMALGTGGHTWQMTAQSNAGIGMKGMLQAAKTLALAGVRAAQNPALLAQAKAEYAAACPDGYHCPMSADALPEPVL
ncbi:MAG: amidohydrolase [Ruthenibacterium sp.]